MQPTPQPSRHEQIVVKIMRRLPPERLAELVDFARFLEFQTMVQYEARLEETVGNDEWDQLLARPEAKHLLHELAREARADYEAGQTTDINLTQDGRLTAE